MAINEKQELFIQAYLLHRNATEAARAAGYGGNSTQAFANQGFRLLNTPEIKEVRGVKSDQDVDKSTEDRKVSIVKNLKILGKEKAMELIKLCEFK